jgi:hypothetical protein
MGKANLRTSLDAFAARLDQLRHRYPQLKAESGRRVAI